jgi:hypothetical protein
MWTVVLGPGGAIQNLSGTWARFERRGDYDLRPVSAALDELRSGGAWGVRPMMGEGRSVAPALGAPSSAEAPSRPSGARSDSATDVTVAPLPCPLPPDPAVKGVGPGIKDAEAAFPVRADCPQPTVVTVTDVELGLLPAPGWDGQRSRLYLVPAYRFLGHFEDGSRYEAPIVALAPDAIAPPPAFPDKPMPMPMPEATPLPAPAPRD